MATLKIGQEIFYQFKQGETPETSYWSNNLLAKNGTTPISIVRLGIQTLPGVKFSFSGMQGQLETDHSMLMIDHTGIYELDLRDVAVQITNLHFAPESLALIDSLDNASIIVDYATLVEGGAS